MVIHKARLYPQEHPDPEARLRSAVRLISEAWIERSSEMEENPSVSLASAISKWLHKGREALI